MTAFASQHLRVDIDMQRAKWLMVSVLYPGYWKPAWNWNAMAEPRCKPQGEADRAIIWWSTRRDYVNRDPGCVRSFPKR